MLFRINDKMTLTNFICIRMTHSLNFSSHVFVYNHSKGNQQENYIPLYIFFTTAAILFKMFYIFLFLFSKTLYEPFTHQLSK